MRKYLLITFVAIISLAGLSLYFSISSPTSSGSGKNNSQPTVSYDVPNRPAIDRNDIPDNIYKMVCVLGYPMFVSKWDLDPDTRFVFFKGPFKDSTVPNGRVYPYMYQSIKSLKSEQNSGALFLDSIDEYLTQTLPDQRAQFLIPSFNGVPDRLDELIKLVGQWDVEYKLKDPDRLRIIYDKKMCIGERLIIGAYFDVVDGRIVNTKGITNRMKLQWVMANRKKPKADKNPLQYTQNIPAEGTAKHVVTQLVLLKEAGKRSEALALISKTQQSEFFRNELTKQVDPTTSIDLDRFTYQAIKYTRDSAEISVFYYLKNGTLIDTKYMAVLEDGHWRIKH